MDTAISMTLQETQFAKTYIYIYIYIYVAWRAWSSNMIVLCLIIRLRDKRKASEKTTVVITCTFCLVAEIR